MRSYLNTRTLPFSYKISLFYERLRKIFIFRGLYISALSTYSLQCQFFHDRNNSAFWDNSFAKTIDKSPIKKWRHSVVLGEISEAKNILNIGIGTGDLESQLFSLFPDIDYSGIDITNRTLSLIKNKFPKKIFLKENAEKTSFKKESFDQICLLEVIEHIKSNKTFIVLREINRILKQNGKFIISFPVNEGLDKMLPDNPSSHMRLYSLNLLKFEIIVSGFKVTKIYKASAFKNAFFVKNFINSIFNIKKPNNYVLVCSKK